MAVEFTVEAPGFARGLSNALAFIPAASKLKNVYLCPDASHGLIIVGTDSLAVGMETVPVSRYKGPAVDRVQAFIGKAEATELERGVRAAGKAHLSVSFRLDGLHVPEIKPAVTPFVQEPEMFRAYQYLVGRIGAAEKRKGKIPAVACVDPALFSRFAKVKADKPNGRMADILFGDDELEPWLIKIGPTFKGLLMPIDREINGVAVGQDGLW